MKREYNQRRYSKGIIEFSIAVKWSNDEVELLTDLPEYLVEELDSYFEELDMLAEEEQ